MKILFDFIPILIFFVAYKTYDIYVATAAAIVASIVQVGFTWWKTRKLEGMQLATLAIIVFFGGATLLLEDEMFIKWKPTVVNWLLGGAFFVSQFVGKKTLVEHAMGANVQLPHPIWTRLNLSWALFFISLGFVNLYVMYNYDTDTWVNFKLFGMLALTVVFVLAQGLYLSRHIKDPETKGGE